METFADYILSEENLYQKMEIVRHLAQRKSNETGKSEIFFDKSVILKTEIAKMFLDYTDICQKDNIDKNLVLTACLLCNCKKVDNAQNLEKLHAYAREGAQYLLNLGFDQRFCKICEEVNRYSDSKPREKESDILELVDQFGGMLLDRPERIGFKPDEALALLEHRNLKDYYNRYMNTFSEFVQMMENVYVEV
jgi:hypothetical protein